MVNITELQSLIQDVDFWRDRNIVAIMGLPGSGISTVLSELSESKVEREADMKYIYINMYSIGKKTEFQALRHIAYEIKTGLHNIGISKEFDFSEDDFYKLKISVLASLKKIRTKYKFALILDNIDNVLKLQPYFYEVLREIAMLKLDGDVSSIKFILASDGFIDDEGLIDNLGKFYPFVYENVLFISGFEVGHISEVLEGVAKNNVKTANEIHDFSGGNPKIVDRLLDYYSAKAEEAKEFSFDDKRQILIDDKEVAYIVYRIWDGLAPKQIKILSKIQNEKLFELNQTVLSNLFLLETGLINKVAANQYTLGVKLLELTLVDYLKGEGSSLDELVSEDKVKDEDSTQGVLTGAAADVAKTSANNAGGKTTLQKKEEDPDADIKGVNLDVLSKQEFKVFAYFREKRWRLITKDEIANLMWGRKRRSRKDDWAIDQLMKRLRNKLGDEVGNRLYTVRGRGYRYVPL